MDAWQNNADQIGQAAVDKVDEYDLYKEKRMAMLRGLNPAEVVHKKEINNCF